MGYGTGLIAVLLLVGLAIWRRDWNTGKDNSKTPLIKSLAVLPLENLSGDSSQDYFADGMTDELITDLSQISSLRVISRTSVLPYKKTEKPLRQIGRELDVDAVVEGTVLRFGERLALQNQVASDIADEIRIRIGAAPGVIKKNTQLAKPRAYEAYLKGRYFWDQRSTQGITKAFDYFNEAIREDPNFALPYAGLAEVYAALPDYMAIPPRDSYSKAESADKVALSLDDTLAEHTLRWQASC
jgi:TolB-like protein